MNTQGKQCQVCEVFVNSRAVRSLVMTGGSNAGHCCIQAELGRTF